MWSDWGTHFCLCKPCPTSANRVHIFPLVPSTRHCWEIKLHPAAEVSNGGQVGVVSDPLKRVGGSFEKMLTIRVKFSRVCPSDKELCGNNSCFKKSCVSIESSDWWSLSTSGALIFHSGHAFCLTKENKSHALYLSLLLKHSEIWKLQM